MKKLIAAVVVGAFLMSVGIGCSNPSTPAKSGTSTTTPKTGTGTETPPKGKT